MSNVDPTQAEIAAIRARYGRRADRPANPLGELAPDLLLRAQAYERALAHLLRDCGVRDVGRVSLLEVGCGEGINLLQFIRLGFNPALMVGNDLRAEAVDAARRILPQTVRLVAGEASTTPLGAADGFDVVVQSTVFSSILSDDLQLAVAQRMWALTKPGGAVLWYDLGVNNPWNPDVRGVPLPRIATLFPHGRITARRVTLAPPVARKAARLHPAIYTVLDAVPWLRSHLLCWIAKQAET
ncbi:MAG: class I SAM-dependent methyltransferase [Rhodospirillaceae bacterium]|nr:class I SAM-dependent methyltransferase [Rhodospirillaceae bacterium]